MAKTFYDESEYFSNIEEPMFTRSRKTYRGERSSAEENLEINSLIVNFNRIKNSIESLNSLLDTLSSNLVYSTSVYTQSEALNDGRDYSIEGVEINIDNGEYDGDMILETISKISGKISKLESKISRLENGK